MPKLQLDQKFSQPTPLGVKLPALGVNCPSLKESKKGFTQA
jgi:hypothetical protein